MQALIRLGIASGAFSPSALIKTANTGGPRSTHRFVKLIELLRNRDLTSAGREIMRQDGPWHCWNVGQPENEVCSMACAGCAFCTCRDRR